MTRAVFLPNYTQYPSAGKGPRRRHALDAKGHILCGAGDRTLDITLSALPFEDATNPCPRCRKILRASKGQEAAS